MFSVHTFTSAVIQSSVILRAPNCMLANDIRSDFELAYAIFVEVAPCSAVAKRALPILARLRSSIQAPQTTFDSQLHSQPFVVFPLVLRLPELTQTADPTFQQLVASRRRSRSHTSRNEVLLLWDYSFLRG
jgi:hypothetical protein